MAQINLQLTLKTETCVRINVHLHHLPRIGESIDIFSILESSSIEVMNEAKNLLVVAVSHTVSDTSHVHIPTVSCSAAHLSEDCIKFFKSDAKWQF